MSTGPHPPPPPPPLYFFPLNVLKEKVLFVPQSKCLLEFQGWLVQSEDFHRQGYKPTTEYGVLAGEIKSVLVSGLCRAQLPLVPAALYYRLGRVPLMNGLRCATVTVTITQLILRSVPPSHPLRTVKYPPADRVQRRHCLPS